jgi:DNA mismatch repair protein MutH
MDAADGGGEARLLAQARALSGLTLAELSQRLQLSLPAEPRRAKGFVGRLLERALCVTSDSAAAQDFPELGVELKTLPVDAAGRPRESTFVCHVDLARIADCEWEQSRVKHKLSRVLFVPIESGAELLFAQRRVGSAWLWSASLEEERVLRQDYDEIVGRIAAGDIDQLSAHVGQALQLRPKAANATVRTRSSDAEGGLSRAHPRAFYLRATFTAEVLRRAFGPTA